MKAVEAGVDIIDTAMSPFALGTSQPATEVMVEAFKNTPYEQLVEAAGGFKVQPQKLVSGGPMMGFAIFGLDVDVYKRQD